MGCSNFLCSVMLISLLLLPLSLMVASSIPASPPTDTTSPTTPNNIFVLAGQSNMAGRGGVTDGAHWDGTVPTECQPNPLILRFSNMSMWEEAAEPLHRDIDTGKPCGIGPGMPFADSLLKRDSSIGMIGLIPCAIGGSKISEWERGTKNYDRLLSRAYNASLNGTGGQIRAILWYQGESDTDSVEDIGSYKSKLESFFIDVRSDLQLPTLPIIQVALASGEGNWSNVESIRTIQKNINLPNVTTIDAKGLELMPINNYLHLTSAAQVRLGQMMADAFITSFIFT